jgi:hypothetical protein
MKCASSTTIERKPKLEPAEVPVEDLVVDDEDVGERVDVVGHHGEHRVGVRDGGRHDGLRGLAEARLVGEQEGAVPLLHALQEPGLVDHELRAGRREPVDQRLRRQLHRGRLTARALLERPVQRAEQVPAGEATGEVLVVTARQVRREERVGQRARGHGLRHDLPGGDLRRHHRPGRLGSRDDEVLLGELRTGLEEPVAAHLLGRRAGLGVRVEEGQQARVAGGDLRQDRGDPVEALEQVGSGGRGERGVLADAGALRAHEQRHDEELRAVRRAGLALAGDAGLHLPDPAGEHGDERRRVVLAGARLALSRGLPLLLLLLLVQAVGRTAADARCHVPPDDAADVERSRPARTPWRDGSVSAADSARVPVDAPSRAPCPVRRTGACA